MSLYPALKVEIRELDVSRFDEISPVFNDLAEAIGGINVVVANAGVIHTGLVGTGKIESIKETVDVNFTGAVVTIDTAVRYFNEHPGIPAHVVGILSVVAFRGTPGASVYSATKAGLDLYLNVVAQEAIQTNSGLIVTAVYPGPTESEMTNDLKHLPHLISAESSARQIYGLIKAKAPQGIVPLL